MANRALPLAALACGETELQGLGAGQNPEDICLMLGALSALGINASTRGAALHIEGGKIRSPKKQIQAGDAGTVLRFILPLAAMHCAEPVRFACSERLLQRPLQPLLGALQAIGAEWRPEPNGGILIPPQKKPQFMAIEIASPQSSQFISGMAMAAADLPKGGMIKWAGRPASLGYIELTAKWLQKFGCSPQLGQNAMEIPGSSLRPITEGVPGDWSAAAAVFCAAALLGRQVTVFPLIQADGQPDAAILQILGKAGSAWHFEEDKCHFQGQMKTGIKADLSNCPDLAPVLAAAAALAPGTSELQGLEALPRKESDRLQGIKDLVEWLGGKAIEKPGFKVEIQPRKTRKTPYAETPFDPKGDHRMAFAAAVGGLLNGGAVLGPACVAKSFPGFWEAWEKMLG
jgi:3-phosphoshikimate 1-carboxyvinyltransferase